MGKLYHLLPPMLLYLLLFLLLALPLEQKQTALEPSSEPAPIVQTIPSPAETEPEQAEPAAHPVGECVITYYDPCVLCCGKADGITYSGTKAEPYETCAVDPAVIPLGSTVLVDFGDGVLRRYRAEDVGGSVEGSHIDICVSGHQEALELGVRKAEVWWEESMKVRG